MRSRSIEITIAVAAVVSGVVVVLGWPPLPIRTLATILLVFILPGLAVTQALGYPATMLSWERVAWTVGSSISITVLGGIGLNFTGKVLSPPLWAAFLTAVTLDAVVWALFRPARRTEVRAMEVPGLSGQSVGLLLIAGLAVVAALTLAQLDAAVGLRPTASQLWIVPSDGSSVRVGIRSHEPAETDFRLTLEGTEAPAEWVLRLAPGETHEITISADGAAGPIRARLSTANSSEPIREVVYWPRGST